MAATQKVALITAGTAGLGAQIARVLAPDYRVVINFANNADRAASVLKELEAIPSTHTSPSQPRFHAVQGDVGNRDAINKLVDETVKTMGRLDVVVSNAGWTRITNFFNIEEQMEESDWDKCFLYNVKAHLWLAYASRNALKESQGTFITTASVAGVKPSGSSLPYAVTKAAAIHLTKSLANIMAPDVRCNSVSPGLLLTEWGMKFSEEKREKSRQNSKLKRLATVEDVAEQVRCLAKNNSMTGNNILLDGGLTL
ncbi:oxidoreductase ucpA [Myriangium duriaei CBS 260.36]|uniref:Oxidoreductase ucpA n=1 Tax=Myriangium duriaei CBS 260.36 TaxID=1168546 RepID=A0A9P4J8P6_9PEZI|nr:oxidoreductase ucpA [Myriangium duriaei CBS 260.36]